jgi:hypothetical protein
MSGVARRLRSIHTRMQEIADSDDPAEQREFNQLTSEIDALKTISPKAAMVLEIGEARSPAHRVISRRTGSAVSAVHPALHHTTAQGHAGHRAG